MIGIDSNLLIAFELSGHPQHLAARSTIARALSENRRLVVTAQVLAEFVHVVTDSRRFAQPVSMDAALATAKTWMTNDETIVVATDKLAIVQFVEWMSRFKLGRKRVLDTMLAATYRSAGIVELMTLNEADFRVFNVFKFVEIRT